MEPGWPPTLSELLSLTAEKREGRAAMRERLPVLLKPYLKLLAGRTVVKVTGTNGKGSLCAMLEACMRFEGLRAGLFTSPHLSRVTERFRVAGAEVSQDALERHAAEALGTVRRVVESHGVSYTPSFFECLIIIAIGLFAEARVDAAIFEAGVGGYNDATSLLPGEFAVITSIGLDHKERLGDLLVAVAADKAGIAPAGSHLILGPDIAPAPRAVIEADAAARGVTVTQATYAGLQAASSGLRRPTLVELSAGGRTYRYNLPLLGRHQVGNFATLVELVGVMARRGVVSTPDCLKGVEGTRWAGRLEVRDGAPAMSLTPHITRMASPRWPNRCRISCPTRSACYSSGRASRKTTGPICRASRNWPRGSTSWRASTARKAPGGLRPCCPPARARRESSARRVRPSNSSRPRLLTAVKSLWPQGQFS